MKHNEIKSIQQLANYLRCSYEFLNRVINNEFIIIDHKATLKTTFPHDVILIDRLYIKKKGKVSGFRIVHSIRTFQFENSLKILNTFLSALFSPESSVHGFIKGKSTKTNACLHLGKQMILSVDIENYFETITKEMIAKALHELGFTKEVSEWISCITTIQGHLVQGFCTSPTIANMVTARMDKDFAKLCGDRTVYSRYADDLYFSSNDTIPTEVDICTIISKYGFRLNDKKTKLMKRGQNQYVTGLTVFDDKIPRIPKSIKRNLRLEIHYVRKLGYTKHAIRRLKNSELSFNNDELEFEIHEEIIKTEHRLFGWIHYIQSIEPEVGRKLHSRLLGAKR